MKFPDPLVFNKKDRKNCLNCAHSRIRGDWFACMLHILACLGGSRWKKKPILRQILEGVYEGE